MLSIGIRCGQGFDRQTLRRLIELRKSPYEFDILILGNNAGGIACAKEAAKNGKKVALVYWRIPTPGENEGLDEDRTCMADVLLMRNNFISNRTYEILEEDDKAELISAVKVNLSRRCRTNMKNFPLQQSLSQWTRKVRESKLDLTNAIKNMAVEGLAYLHEVAIMNDILKSQRKTSKIPSWSKTSEQLMDYIIERNWTILTDFIKNRVSLYEGFPVLVDEHTVSVLRKEQTERLITAEIIISALELHNTLPKDVEGAYEFGVNVDDFFRLSKPPGRTLIVGGGVRGMECAGILASFGFPVVVVDRVSILNIGDSEILSMIKNDLRNRGVIFMENKSLVSISKNENGEHLVVKFRPLKTSIQNKRFSMSEEFDTVLFTTKEKLDLKKSGKTALQVEIERLTGETYLSEEKHLFENIIDIPDHRHNEAITELLGNHTADQLSNMEEYPRKLISIPITVMTPTEYAYIGLSEKFAGIRIGKDCIRTFTGYFSTEDFAVNNELKDKTCYAKIITLPEKDLIIGLHLFGRGAIQIMNEVMEPIKRKMLVSNLHPALKTILEYPEVENNE